MPQTAEGATYAPAPMPQPVVGPGELVFAAAHLDQGLGSVVGQGAHPRAKPGGQDHQRAGHGRPLR